MSRIDGNVTDLAPRILGGGQGSSTTACWMCQTGLSCRAAFCHDCGTIQAPRALDHFARLGLDCRFDIDRAQLAGRTQAMARIFEAERFAAKGPRQKQLALEHLAAIEEAHTVLRDPVRRAEYLLTLVEGQGASSPVVANSNDIDVLRGQLKTAADSAAVDKVAFAAGQRVEACIRELSAAFRQQSFTEVAIILARLAQFEDIAASARAQRAGVQ
jgi:molecular chaperone HscB